MLSPALPQALRSMHAEFHAGIRLRLASVRDAIIPVTSAIMLAVPVLVIGNLAHFDAVDTAIIGASMVVMLMVIYAFYFKANHTSRLVPILSYRPQHWILMLTFMAVFYLEMYAVCAIWLLPYCNCAVPPLRWPLAAVCAMASFCWINPFRYSAAPRVKT